MLPRLVTSTYELEIPSSKRKIKYRPFLVKEEKILIIAVESKDLVQITEAIKTVLSNCILSKGFDLNKLSSFDIEYLFLNIRAKSVGETVEVSLICPDDQTTVVKVPIHLDEIGIKYTEGHTTELKLNDTTYIKMRYPGFKEFAENNFDSNDEITGEKAFELVISCIDQIYTEEESWAASDHTGEELDEFLGQLTSDQFKLIDNFFNTSPKLSHTIVLTNPKTKVKSEVVLEGLQAFLG
jgi:hypothetical protein